MSGWDDLVAVALLGTERRAPKLDALPEVVRAGLPEAEDPAVAVLEVAAVLAGYRRAGRVAERGLEPIEPARADHRPVPRPRAVRRLAGMLDGVQAAVLPEWLRAVAERGYRVPPEHLPALADLAKTRPQLRPDVVAAAGPRGPWLARLNPEWRFLVPDDDTPAEAWEHGTLAQRREWLLTTRRREPAAARAALAASWPTEPANVRADLLKVLGTDLSRADEEFCETALDDRAVQVRRIAAALLAALPKSRYAQRMTERVRACLTTKRRALRRGTLMVTLPAQCDQSMQRDGIDPRPRQVIGERAWWLREMIAAAPLATYRDLAESPDEFLRYDVDGMDRELLHAALAEAIVRERSVRWARALLAVDPSAGHRTTELLAILPKPEWTRVVVGLRGTVDLADVVGGLPAPWPTTLARALLDLLSKATTDQGWARLASITGRAVPADALDHPLVQRPAGEEETWRRRLIETLQFRRDMYEEL